MGRRLPPLNALRAFDIAARTRSFTAAADELHVSQGAVSRHVAQLEAYLGIALFRREPGGARLTAAGSDYARSIGDAFDSVERATRCAAAATQRRPLRIKLFPSVAIKWLITRLAEFHALHPAVEVSITTTPKFVRFDPEEDDFTVQIGNVPQPGVQFDKLIVVELLPVCSADYLRRLPVGTVEDLFEHVLLCSVQRPNDWLLWFRAAGVPEDRLRQVVQSGLRFGMKFGNSALAYQAAINGMGVVIAQQELVRDDLASGRLVRAWPLVAASGEIYYLASSADPLGNPEVIAFRDWILSKSNVEVCTSTLGTRMAQARP
jgi:LysR family transcriptional regulator, glycine cleavage system transcriptional activator